MLIRFNMHPLLVHVTSLSLTPFKRNRIQLGGSAGQRRRMVEAGEPPPHSHTVRAAAVGRPQHCRPSAVPRLLLFAGGLSLEPRARPHARH